MIAEALAVGVVSLASIGFGAFLANANRDDDCGGHHWGEKKPTTDPQALVEGERVDNKEFAVSRVYNKAKLSVNAKQKCEDCGKIRYVEMEVGRIQLADFVPDE